MQSGNMYMMPLDSPWYALVPTRIWYKPWRWNLDGYLLPSRIRSAVVYNADTRPLASNIRYDETIALMQIMGAINIGD
jgi:hypothetical protein